ncbi:immunoglobulin-like domain-containing protein, partial [Flavobacterium chungangense]|uniref:immunoglobulin-like domain-containing protein n=1 Tax=Flavobacterium chungangense TaxID=554283 RepID=UPI0015DFD7EE
TVTLSGTASIAENAAGTATITATLSTATTTDTVVSLGFTGTASAGDYAASNTTITIPAGQLTGTITIDPTDDAVYEGNETVIVDITNVTGATAG